MEEPLKKKPKTKKSKYRDILTNGLKGNVPKKKGCSLQPPSRKRRSSENQLALANETQSKDFSKLQNIMTRNVNVGCEFWDKIIQVKGFTTELEQRIENAFQLNSQEMISRKQLIRTKPDQIFQWPLFLLWLEKQNVDHIKTNTASYKLLINHIIDMTLDQEKKTKETHVLDIFAPTKDDEILKQRKQVQDFAKIALNHFINQNYSFTDEDLKDLSGNILVDLLVKPITEDEETRLQTMNKSLVEFLAALSVFYITECKDTSENMRYEKFKTTISKMVHQGLTPSLDSMFFPFLAGLMEERADWLFDALSPWSAIYNVCQPEIINVLTEISNPNDKIIQSLIKFIPANYTIGRFSDNCKQYYTSKCHKKLFQMSVERKLISMLHWDLSVLHSLPVKTLKIRKLHLSLSDCISSSKLLCEMPSAASIYCDELICEINNNVSESTTEWLISYISCISKINAKQHHLHLSEIDLSFWMKIFKEILKDQWKHMSFERVRLSKIPLDDDRLKDLVELVKTDRIRTGICLNLHEESEKQLAAFFGAVPKLWDAVLQTSSIDEFTFKFTNCKFKFNFDFLQTSILKRKTRFQMIQFEGHFDGHQTESICCIDSIQELVLRNLGDNNLTEILRNIRGVDSLECSDHLFSSFVSSNLSFVSILGELYLDIYDNPLLPSACSVVDQLKSLHTMTLSLSSLSFEIIPQPVDDFLVAVLNSQKLRHLGFHSIPSAAVLDSLMHAMSKVKLDIDLVCLELTFNYKEKFDLPLYVLSPVKVLLKQKQLAHVAIVDTEESSPLRAILPVLFFENEFQFKHEINGYEAGHSIRNRSLFERSFIIQNRFVIEFKHDPDCCYSMNVSHTLHKRIRHPYNS